MKELVLQEAHVETQRGLILHVSKRIPCSCLDQMKSEAKAMPKVVFCCACEEEKPTEEMLMCSGCKIKQYCSAECSRADWPYHKDDCSTWRAYHEESCMVGICTND